MTAPPLPSALFVNCADWTRADEYPSVEHTDRQDWAWEFLRRNARYTTEYAALQTAIRALTHEFCEDEIDDLNDEFCLRWSVTEPCDPRVGWNDWPAAKPKPHIGELTPKVFRPPALIASSTGRECNDVAHASIAITGRQVLLRVCLDDDITAQLGTAKELLLAAGKRKPILQRDNNGQVKLAAPPAAKANFRVRLGQLHFVLRTLDAMAQSANFRRADITVPDDFADGDGNSNASRSAIFGEGSDERRRSLAKDIARILQLDSKSGKFADGTVIQATSVRGWMRIAYWYAAEQGYAQIATERITT